MDFYGTIGPACAELSTLQQMVRAGMTGLRMNLSHGSLAEHADWLELIQKAGVRTLLIDLQGPELRIGRLASPLTLSEGQQVFLGTGGIPCPACLLDAITPGQKLLLDDGKLLLRVNAVDTALHCTVLRGGLLQSRKSIAVPGVEVSSPTLTDEDLQNLRVAAGCGVTGVMLPFVRSAEDIRTLRAALEDAHAGQIQIFAKIENLAGVRTLPEFLPLVDQVVIARGDLGPVGAAPLPEAAGLPLPGRGRAFYGRDPDAGQYADPGGPHPRRGQRHLQCRTGRGRKPDADGRDRRRAVPRAGHGIPCQDRTDRAVNFYDAMKRPPARLPEVQLTPSKDPLRSPVYSSQIVHRMIVSSLILTKFLFDFHTISQLTESHAVRYNKARTAPDLDVPMIIPAPPQK